MKYGILEEYTYYESDGWGGTNSGKGLRLIEFDDEEGLKRWIAGNSAKRDPSKYRAFKLEELQIKTEIKVDFA